MAEGSGERFIQQKYRELHKSAPVKHEQKRRKRAGEISTEKPPEMIRDFMQVLERTHLTHRDDPRVMERIKRHYHKKHVIEASDIPQSYWNAQAKMMIEEGRGGDLEMSGIEKKTLKDKSGNERTDYLFPDNLKKQNAEVVISDQKSTLDNWINYFTSPDADVYPMWAKYWAFNNMLKLSSFDKEKKQFGKRRKDTVAPFPDLNREALAYVVDVIIKKAKQEQIPAAENNAEFKKLVEGESFAKLYAWAIEKVTVSQESELQVTAGEWIKYQQKSDHMPLVKSLQGHATGWCTAGEETAKAQLSGGDFHVYYSHDPKGSPTIPRVAIRMQGGSIGEVRGIAPDQNLDPYIGDIAEQKLQEFGPEGEKYQKKVQDMKRLTFIEKLYRAGEKLTKEDLRFLYEIDNKIEGFGYQKDPRIGEILAGRDIKADLSLATGFSQNEISLTKEEALRGNIKFYYGDLPLVYLTSAEGLKLPESMSGDLFLDRLTSAEGLELPESVGGALVLSGLTSAEGLKLPESMGGALVLRGLTSAEGLKLPESVGGALVLSGLTSAEVLKLPESVGGALVLSGLTSAEVLKLPESVGGNLDLSGLTSAEGLKLPELMTGCLYLTSLTSAEGLKLPESESGDLDLSGLTSAEGLKLPESVGGDLNLYSLTSAEGLKLPESVGGNLYLTSLTSAEVLKLPESMGGDIYLGKIPENEKEALRKKYPNLKIR